MPCTQTTVFFSRVNGMFLFHVHRFLQVSFYAVLSPLSLSVKPLALWARAGTYILLALRHVLKNIQPFRLYFLFMTPQHIARFTVHVARLLSLYMFYIYLCLGVKTSARKCFFNRFFLYIAH